MKLVIQRVKNSKVKIEGKTVGEIGKGFNVLVGINKDDNMETIKKCVDKMLNLRVFEDSEGKMNLSLNDVKGELLIISQFTLYADCKKGRRPSFVNAAPPQISEPLYEKLLEYVRENFSGKINTGVFGADMEVTIINDGPSTFILDSEEL